MFIPRSDPFWKTNAQYAQAAARNLGIPLHVTDFHDNPSVLLADVERVCRDGVGGIIFQTFADTGEAVLKIAEKHQTPAFMINSLIKSADFPPRTKYLYWVGSIAPDDAEVGTMIIQQLLGQAREEGVSTFHVLGIEGRPDQEASILRRRGLEEYIKYAKGVTSFELVPGDWDPATAARLFKKHYAEDPDLNIVWCANDNMALAVADAVAALGITKPLFIGGADWDPRALRAIGKGRLTVSVGGHFIEGAWAVLLMYDYLHDKDFASDALEFTTEMHVITKKNLSSFSNFLALNPETLNFRNYSRAYNPRRTEYDLDLMNMVREAFRPKNKPSRPLALSDEEKSWINAHRNITVAVMNSWPPLSMVVHGKPEGIDADYLRLLGKRVGVTFRVVAGAFMENIDAVHTKRIDALMDVTPKPDREKYLDFTKPYLNIPHVIIARSNGPFYENEEHLSGKTVALEDGFGNIAYFRKNYPRVNIATYPDTAACLKAISLERADAYAGNRAVATYIMAQRLFSNLQVQGYLKKPESVLTIGVRKDWPELTELLNKALDSLTANEKQAIKGHWLDVNERQFRLTGKESAWLKAHPNLRIGAFLDRPPFEFMDEEGRYAGITSEYVRRLQEMIGARLIPKPEQSRSEALEAVRQRKIDIIPGLVPTRASANFLRFTRPYLRAPMVIVTRTTAAYVDSLKRFGGRTVAVAKGYGIQNVIVRDHPEIRILSTETSAAALEAVADGRANAAVETVAALTYLSTKLGIRNLKVAAPTPYSFHLSFAVRADMPELATIFDNALSSIPKKDKAVFQEHWINIRVERRVNWPLVVGIVLAVTLVAAGILTVITRANRRLALEVRERTRAEQQIQAMSSAIHDALIMIDDHGKVMFWNQAAEELFGIGRDEARGMEIHGILAPPQNRDAANAGMEVFAKTGKGAVIGKLQELTALRADGTPFPAEIAVSAFQVSIGWYAVGIVRDISERKQGEQTLKQNLEELERFSRLVVGREERMIGLKEEINVLLRELGRKEKYKIVE